MTKRTPAISFEKWANPFEIDLKKQQMQAYPDDDDDDEIVATQMKAIFSPMGLVVLPEHMAIENQFDFWSAHTNENLIPAVVQLIEQVDGVETLEIQTRYRCRIGIGKLFKPRDVMANITKVYKIFWKNIYKSKK